MPKTLRLLIILAWMMIITISQPPTAITAPLLIAPNPTVNPEPVADRPRPIRIPKPR